MITATTSVFKVLAFSTSGMRRCDSLSMTAPRCSRHLVGVSELLDRFTRNPNSHRRFWVMLVSWTDWHWGGGGHGSECHQGMDGQFMQAYTTREQQYKEKEEDSK